MVKPLFRQSFLYDTLDFETEMTADQIKLPSGPTVRLLKRGLLEVIPFKLDDQTKSVVISAGVHGDETAPMELIDCVVADILANRLEVKEHCLFMFAHPEATNKRVRFIDENLNRLFDERETTSSKEGKLAVELMQDTLEFFKATPESQRWHFDLHCAIRPSKHVTFAVSPKSKKPTRSRELFSFVEKAQLEAILLANAPSGTFSWYSAEYCGAQALTVELGQVAPLGEGDQEQLKGFDTALRGLLSRNLQDLPANSVTPYRVTQTIKRINDDFDFTFGDDVENFTQFEHGQVLGHDGDKLLFAKVDQEAVVFPNRHVAPGQRAALMVCEVETRFEDDQLVYD